MRLVHCKSCNPTIIEGRSKFTAHKINCCEMGEYTCSFHYPRLPRLIGHNPKWSIFLRIGIRNEAELCVRQENASLHDGVCKSSVLQGFSDQWPSECEAYMFFWAESWPPHMWKKLLHKLVLYFWSCSKNKRTKYCVSAVLYFALMVHVRSDAFGARAGYLPMMQWSDAAWAGVAWAGGWMRSPQSSNSGTQEI
jgi:hypothetical protein